MKQEERWMQMWKEYMDFLTTNKRRPSKYDEEERTLVNWMKHNRKIKNQGKMPPQRMPKLQELVAMSEKYQRVNQHQYTNGKPTKRVVVQQPVLDLQ